MIGKTMLRPLVDDMAAGRSVGHCDWNHFRPDDIVTGRLPYP